MNTDKIKIMDSKEFIYMVDVEHSPHHGFSVAKYRGSIIADCQLGRILQPMSDDDREWEMYEERFSEWKGEILTNLRSACKNYFDRK